MENSNNDDFVVHNWFVVDTNDITALNRLLIVYKGNKYWFDARGMDISVFDRSSLAANREFYENEPGCYVRNLTRLEKLIYFGER